MSTFYFVLLLLLVEEAEEIVCCYSSGQNKVPTAELKSRLIVVQKSLDSPFIVVL